MGTVNYGALAATAGEGLEPLPLSTYDVEITNAEFKEASTGSPMYKVTFTIESGAHRGRKVWNNLVCATDNPASVSFFFGKMATLGLDAGFFAGLDGSDEENQGAICQALLGKRCKIKIKHRTWKGQTQNEVDAILAPSGNGPSLGDTATPAPASPRAKRSTSSAPDLPPGM